MASRLSIRVRGKLLSLTTAQFDQTVPACKDRCLVVKSDLLIFSVVEEIGWVAESAV